MASASDNNNKSCCSDCSPEAIQGYLREDNINHILSEMVQRNNKKWNIANTRTIIEWLNYANIYLLYLEVYQKHCSKLMRNSTMLSLIISTITSTLSISQVSISEASEGSMIERLIKFGVVGTSIATSVITGYIKIEKIEDKMEILRIHRRKWVDFVGELINNIQCPTEHRVNAEELIQNLRGRFNALFSKRLNIPGFIKERAANIITPTSSDLIDILRYYFTCCSPSKLAKRSVVRKTKRKITRYAITNQILKDELDLLRQANPQHIKEIRFSAIQINDFLDRIIGNNNQSKISSVHVSSNDKTLDHSGRNSVVDVRETWDPAQLFDYSIIYYDTNVTAEINDTLTKCIIHLINQDEFTTALYQSDKENFRDLMSDKDKEYHHNAMKKKGLAPIHTVKNVPVRPTSYDFRRRRPSNDSIPEAFDRPVPMLRNVNSVEKASITKEDAVRQRNNELEHELQESYSTIVKLKKAAEIDKSETDKHVTVDDDLPHYKDASQNVIVRKNTPYPPRVQETNDDDNEHNKSKGLLHNILASNFTPGNISSDVIRDFLEQSRNTESTDNNSADTEKASMETPLTNYTGDDDSEEEGIKLKTENC